MLNPEEILEFWFEGITDGTVIDKNKMPFKKWFMKDKDFDKEIRNRFEADVTGARLGRCKSWEEDPNGRLALIILFDQFTRNVYRNTPEMFSCDLLALTLTQRFLHDRLDEQLELIERVFAYMPLQHAEDVEIQKLSVGQVENLVDLCRKKNPKNISYFEETLNFAKRHHDIIARFGRFPHRNIILNRPSTKEEAEFLSKPGSSF